MKIAWSWSQLGILFANFLISDYFLRSFTFFDILWVVTDIKLSKLQHWVQMKYSNYMEPTHNTGCSVSLCLLD